MAKFDTTPKRDKRNNRRLMRELQLIIHAREVGDEGTALDREYWDNYSPVEPVQRVHIELSD